MDFSFYEKYRYVGVVADTYNFSEQDIEEMLKIIKEDQFCYDFYNSDKSMELALRAILVRCDLKKNQFYKKLRQSLCTDSPNLHSVKELVGIRASAAYLALCKKEGIQ